MTVLTVKFINIQTILDYHRGGVVDDDVIPIHDGNSYGITWMSSTFGGSRIQDRCNINIFKRFSIIINVRSHRRWRYLDVTNDGNSFSSITINVGSLEFRTATMSIVYSNNSIFNDTKMIIRNDFTSSRKRWKFFLRVQSMSTGSNLGHLRY
ncbi:uncharacterized protein LOC143154522 isoform X1 [Ptiloglossa arizonensis]|uniref:uncharacterized protein LOC143154522 isoform X1 n=1 Tax=Ptiloglossa arizonensis TaxID=3350558 RepID=UPI003F9FC779